MNEIPIAYNPLPTVLTEIADEKVKLLQIYQKEWEVIINTQMHFNDLIIKFRSIVLTAFITLVGASIALKKSSTIDETQLLAIILVLAALWVSAFVMDFFYYHRLLLGSVAQALKFDRSEVGKQYGLFGLTSCISDSVHPPTSKVLVCIFFGIPVVAIVILLYLIF